MLAHMPLEIGSLTARVIAGGVIAIVVIVGVAFFGTQLDKTFDDIGSSVSAVS